jgi:hypothetical protein
MVHQSRTWHPTDDDLERYYLGQIRREGEFAQLEQHLLSCERCLARAKETQDYVDAMRRGIIEGNFDLPVNEVGRPRKKEE